MKKSIIALLHIGFWGCYFMLIMVMLAMYFREDPNFEARMESAFQIMVAFALVPAFITFYSFYFFVFPKILKKNKVLLSIVYEVVISLGAAIVGFAILNLSTGGDCIGEEDAMTNIQTILFMAFVAMISGVIALVIRGFISWFEELKLKEELRQKNHEMELALVKSQLDPHFLFNTINNIDVLILKDADKASDYLNKLSDIMRFMLFETKTDKILLSKEIEYIEKYIELQKIRTNNSKYVDFLVTGNSANKTIAPMLFIPFIENAFKHTNNKKLENAITIHILIAKSSIQLVCKNKFDSSRSTKQESGGLGNELIQKRLNLIYPQKHSLEVVNQNDLYSVELTVNNG